MVAHYHAVGNKTIPVFRKQCFTFTFGVGISHKQAIPGHSVSDQGQKLCFYLSFLNGKATYKQLLLQWRKQEGDRDGELECSGEGTTTSRQHQKHPSPTTWRIQQSQILPPAPKMDVTVGFLTEVTETKSTVTCSLWAAKSSLRLWQWSTTRGCSSPNVFSQGLRFGHVKSQTTLSHPISVKQYFNQKP